MRTKIGDGKPGEKHGEIAKDYATLSPNRHTNVCGRSDGIACRTACLSTVFAL